MSKKKEKEEAKEEKKKGLLKVYKIILPIYILLITISIISMFHAVIYGVEDIFAYLFFVALMLHPIALVFAMKDSKFPLVWLCVMTLFAIFFLLWPYIQSQIHGSPCDVVPYNPNDEYHISDRPCG